ncbi:MAG: hypothetical protein JXB13_22000 [Phycisphaerae bacterium]|nr:hypothetical protein [Phycisphaerae bacterium]
MNALALIIQLICGAVGGNAAGRLIKKIDLGTPLNSIAGILGGGLGGQLLNQAGIGVSEGGSLDLTSVISSIASGGVGGGVLLAIVALVKSAFGKGK